MTEWSSGFRSAHESSLQVFRRYGNERDKALERIRKGKYGRYAGGRELNRGKGNKGAERTQKGRMEKQARSQP